MKEFTKWAGGIVAAVLSGLLVYWLTVGFGGGDRPDARDATVPQEVDHTNGAVGTGQSTPRSTAKPAPTEVAARADSWGIAQTAAVDLDKGDEGTEDEQDIWFEAVTETDRFITPMNDARIAKLDGSDDAEARCANATVSTVPIAISSLAVGDVLCVSTTDNRLAIVTVKALPGPSPGQLFIGFITYDL